MNMQDQDMLKQALKALTPLLQREMKGFSWEYRFDNKRINTVDLQFKEQHLRFNIIVKKRMEPAQLALVQDQARQMSELSSYSTLLVSKLIHPETSKRLQAAGINFIDTCGNIYINDDSVFIFHTGQKSNMSIKDTQSRLFHEAGVRLLFGLLQHPHFLRLTYRDMAAATGVSLGSVNILMNELLHNEYLVETSRTEKKLLRTDALLSQWVAAYHEVLKPHITIGRYHFWDKESFHQYKKINIAMWKALWSGQSAAALSEPNIVPRQLALFVADDNRQWLNGLRLIPTETSPHIEVMRSFWNTEHPLFNEHRNAKQSVPSLLTYADLAISSEEAHIEAASKIKEQLLSTTL